MSEVNEDVKALLTGLSRDQLLKVLAALIGELTIQARAAGLEPDPVDELKAINEIIHRVAGHLRDLTDRNEPFTDSRCEAIAFVLARIGPNGLARLLRLS